VPRFETAIWQHPQAALSAVGRAIKSGAIEWIPELAAVTDSHLSSAAAEGMRAAVLVPLRDAAASGGLIELFASEPLTDQASLETVLTAIAIQLSHVQRLMRTGDTPRWRTGRM
jgi:hypothetical protein